MPKGEGETYRMKRDTKTNAEEGAYALMRGGSSVRGLVEPGGIVECCRSSKHREDDGGMQTEKPHEVQKTEGARQDRHLGSRNYGRGTF